MNDIWNIFNTFVLMKLYLIAYPWGFNLISLTENF